MASRLPSPAAALIPSPVCPFCKVLGDPSAFFLFILSIWVGSLYLGLAVRWCS